MKKFTFLSVLLFLLNYFTPSLQAQVGINNDGTTPDPSAMLDVKSSTRGVLLPRLTSAERDAIADPVPGLIIYNSQEKTLQIFDGPFWRSLYASGCEPPSPWMIYGNGYPECNAAGLVYSIDPVPNSSYYRWTVPPDAAITSGQGSTAITVSFGTEIGNVSVRAEGGCGNSAYTDLPIIIAIPGTPSAIYGNPAPECNATGLVYSIDPIPGATNYLWNVSPNATMTGGQGTTSITVNFGTESGTISVRAENSCGPGNYNSINYSIGIPPPPGTIAGNAYPDKNSTGNPYSIDPVPGASSYHWTVPADASITAGQGTTSIMVTIGVQSGNISVRAENSCGAGDYTDLPVYPFSCGDPITDIRDSKVYPTVLIGSQCWFAKNLNVGTKVPDHSDQSQQSPEIIEKYCILDSEDSCTKYGAYYQWNEMMGYSTVEGSQGICPTGWHIPSDADWCILETHLDNTVDCYGEYWRGTDAGRKLKESGTTHWDAPNDATNTSGFAALGSGYINTSNGYSMGIRTNAYYWTSTATWNATIRMLQNSSPQIYRYPFYYFANGFSVRCLRD